MMYLANSVRPDPKQADLFKERMELKKKREEKRKKEEKEIRAFKARRKAEQEAVGWWGWLTGNVTSQPAVDESDEFDKCKGGPRENSNYLKSLAPP